MSHTVGTCSNCGGRVTVPEVWMGMNPPIPTCQSCGARKRQPHGPTVPMGPPEVPPADEIAASLRTLHPIFAAAIKPFLHD